MLSKAARQQRVRELLADNQVYSQEQLQVMLRARGIDATQATLSRDLRDLGVYKGPEGYQLPSPGSVSMNGLSGLRELERILPASLLSAQVGGNLVVLHTQPAHANPLAIEIDRAKFGEVLGTIAGDDTVFVAAKSPRQAKKLLGQFRRLAGWN